MHLEANVILESITDGFFALDYSWSFTYVNKIAEGFFAKQREEMLGRSIWTLFPIAVDSSLMIELTQAMEDRTPRTFIHYGLKTSNVYEARVFPSSEGITVYFHDITERKKNEEHLQELALIVESSNDGIISSNLDGTIISFNPGAEIIYGYYKEEIIKNHISRLFPLDLNNKVTNLLKQVAHGYSEKNLTLLQKHKDGTLFDVMLSYFPLKNKAGEIRGFSMIVKDITELRRVEKELSRLDRLNLIGQMAAGIAHEIRNPLTVIRGFLQLSKDTKTLEEKTSFYNLMIEEIDRANSIISEFMALGKNKADKITKMNINNALTTLEPLLLTQAVSSGNTLNLEKGTIPEIIIDEKEFRQLIINLVKNGFEAMSTNGCLTIKTYTEANDVILEVRDEGLGINDDILYKIGTPFFSTKDSGNGLGLAICYSIVQRYNGKIDCKTNKTGTTFFVRFPIYSEKNNTI